MHLKRLPEIFFFSPGNRLHLTRVYAFVMNSDLTMKDILKILLLLALTIIGMFSCSRQKEEAPSPVSETNILSNDAYATTENGAVRIAVLTNDQIGDPGTLVFKVPAHGNLQSDSAGFVYQPNPGFTGTEEFFYKYVGGKTTDSAKVSITVR